MSTREVVVAGALPRQQVRSYLKAHKLDWTEIKGNTKATERESTFRVRDATDEQWGQVQDWVKKVTG